MTVHSSTYRPLKPGELIVFSDGQIFRLEKKNRVNWIATGDDGRRYNIKDNGRLQRAPEGTVFTGPPPAPKAVVFLGSVVKFSRSAKSSDDLFVVLKVGLDTVNLAKLGGDNNRFWRSVFLNEIEAVEPHQLHTHFAASSGR